MDWIGETPSIISLTINLFLGWIIKRVADDRKRLMDKVDKLEDKVSAIAGINTKLEAMKEQIQYVLTKLDRLIEDRSHGSN